MKFSELWLRSYVNPPIDSAALSHLLTMAGLEVEAMEAIAPDFSGVVVGHVVAIAPHPDADRLRVCQVEVGADAPLQIVCGAPNVCLDAKVLCAMVGAKLPEFDIKKAKLRGVESMGMLCSARELGMAQETDGLLLLPPDASVGMDVREYLRLNDNLLTLKLTPNRSDCLSVTGIAREVAALTATTWQLPVFDIVPVTAMDMPAVVVTAADACPRYSTQVIHGINRDALTPAWMVECLTRSGLHAISPVVDVTNYVLLELGQPLHAFDLSKLHGGINVRMAHADEMLTLLNEQVVQLDSDMLVIADDLGAQALAGIMGGAATAVDNATTSVLLESAFFQPDMIAGRARRLNLSSDAAHRFERGVDFAQTNYALARATQLIVAICGGTASAVTEVQNQLPTRVAITLRPARAVKVLGIALTHEQVGALLQRAQFDCVDAGDVYHVTPPSYRFDLTIEVDLIEELARLYGYENIPAVPPVAALNMLPSTELSRPVDRLRDVLVGRDYQEVITYGFVDAAWEADLAPGLVPVVLKNPIASQMSVMRSTLMGGLLDVLQTNLNRRQTRVRIMEVGHCYLAQDAGYDQPLRIAGLAYGDVQPEQWGVAARVVDFYDVKADVVAMCMPHNVRFVAETHPALHPGQSAAVYLGDTQIGWLGTLHPALVQKQGLSTAPVLFELAVASLLTTKVPKHGEISRFQAVRRDLAVIVTQNLTTESLLEEMLSAKIATVTDITLFDIYRGKGIDSDKKSLAFRVLMQDNQKTLTDTEVDAVMAQLMMLLQQKFNAQLRS
jgi:phenylalanyl-tRNA synthetase beta chain